MPTETVTLEIDTEAARAFKAAPREEQKKMEVLLGLLLKEITAAEVGSLKEIMSAISRKAQERGLTPETLESILGAE